MCEPQMIGRLPFYSPLCWAHPVAPSGFMHEVNCDLAHNVCFSISLRAGPPNPPPEQYLGWRYSFAPTDARRNHLGLELCRRKPQLSLRAVITHLSYSPQHRVLIVTHLYSVSSHPTHCGQMSLHMRISPFRVWLRRQEKAKGALTKSNKYTAITPCRRPGPHSWPAVTHIPDRILTRSVIWSPRSLQIMNNNKWAERKGRGLDGSW